MSDVKIAGSDTQEIARLWPVMRELRPTYGDAAAFAARVRHLQQTQPGWTLAYLEEDGAPVAAATFRVVENLAWGKALYVDDLVTLPEKRSRGHGKTLMQWLEARARAEGCKALHLDSGTQRQAAHRFYHRRTMAITSFHFGKPL
jgi:GNAT superfamily N-acetyltransferase